MNLFQNIFSPELTAAIGETFMHSLWQITGLGILLALGLLVVGRKASRSRYRMGVGALTSMLVMPILTFFYVYEPAAPTAVVDGASLAATATGFGFIPTASLSGETILEAIQNFFNANGFLVMGLWLMGALFFTLRLTGSYLQVRSLRHRHTSPAPAALQATLEKLKEKMNLRQRITLLESSVITSPMVIGALKPVVLVPMGLATGLNQDQIECLLAHELAHVRRMDYLVNVFQSIVEIVLFFHPMVWWVSKLVREERENCCDLDVIDVKENRIVYARALLNLETIRNANPELALASTGGKLFERIQRITGQESVEKATHSRGIFLGLLCLCLVLTFSTTQSEKAMASNPIGNLLPPEIQFDEDQKGNQVAELVEDVGETVNDLGQTVEELSALQVDLIDDMSSIFKFVNHNPMAQDTPISAIVLVEDGEEVRVRLDRNGKVVAVNKNGRDLGQSEFDRYQDMVDDTFFQYARKSGRSTAPPAPGFPSAPDIKMTPPPAPRIDMGNLPPMPAPPARMDGESDSKFERRMEAFEEEMEEWGESVEEMVESQDWEGYEDEMEKWGADIELQFSSKDWEKFEKDIEAWAEEFAAKFEDQDWEVFAEKIEIDAEHLAEELGDWGEKFGAEMEEMARSLEIELEELADGSRKMERELEREMERERERADREMERERARIEREIERDIRENKEELRDGIDLLQEELDDDGLVDEGDAFKLKINDEDLYINGNRQSKRTHSKYRKIVENMGIPVDSEEFIDINFKRGNTKIKN